MYDDYDKNLRKNLGRRFIAGAVVVAIMLLIWFIAHIFGIQIILNLPQEFLRRKIKLL
jgi:hypothetical protein